MDSSLNRSNLITICGSKGLVGTSTVTTQLAQVLGKRTGSDILLVDLDVQNQGELARMANTSGVILDDFLKEKKTGRVIQVGDALFGYVGIEIDTIKTLFAKAVQRYKYVLVDTGTAFHSISLPCFSFSKIIYLVVLQNLMVLDRCKFIIDELFWRGFSRNEIYTIVNRYRPTSPITPSIVEKMLGVEVCAVIPDMRDICSDRRRIGQRAWKPLQLPEADRIYAQMVDLIIQQKQVQKSNLGGSQKKLNDDKKISSPVMGVRMPKEVGPDAAKTFFQACVKRRQGKKKNEPRIMLKSIIHKKLVDMLELKQNSVLNTDDPVKRQAFYQRTRGVVIRLLDEMADEENKPWQDRQDRDKLIQEILDEALGLGPLENLLSDELVTEIMVNGPDQIYVERSGRLEALDISFSGDDQLMAIIERIVAPMGRRVDEKSPMVDARLPDGSRVNAIINPLSLDGPALTIRKFSKRPYTVDDLISFGSMTHDIADLLRAAVQSRVNILVSGGTGTGKTTLLNVLSSFISPNERIITLEDSAELQLTQPHVLRCEARPPNIEGSGRITIRDLLKNALRMRPDRIIIGECRSGEALDMLQAMNTGHDGSMTTIHANTPEDSLRRLETLALFAGIEIPAKAIREQISSAIGLVVQLTRMANGTRKVTSLTEQCGIEDGQVIMEDIVRFRIGEYTGDADKGEYLITGYIPSFVKRLKAKGVELPKMYRDIV